MLIEPTVSFHFISLLSSEWVRCGFSREEISLGRVFWYLVSAQEQGKRGGRLAAAPSSAHSYLHAQQICRKREGRSLERRLAIGTQHYSAWHMNVSVTRRQGRGICILLHTTYPALLARLLVSSLFASSAEPPRSQRHCSSGVRPSIVRHQRS